MDGCPDVWHKAYADEGNRLLTGPGSDEYPNGAPLALFYPLVVSGNRGCVLPLFWRPIAKPYMDADGVSIESVVDFPHFLMCGCGSGSQGLRRDMNSPTGRFVNWEGLGQLLTVRGVSL